VIDHDNQDVVHHMEVYHCENSGDETIRSMIMYDGRCTAENLPDSIKQCRRVVGAWAMGAEVRLETVKIILSGNLI